MNDPIAFVSTISDEQQSLWLINLRKALPDETIISMEDLSHEQASKVKIAVVANPSPSDFKKLPSLLWIQSLWAGVEKIAREPMLKNMPIARLIDHDLACIMSEAVLAWTLYLHRKMPEYQQQQQKKVWQQLTYKPAHEQRVTVLGVGELGLAAIKMLIAAGFQVSAWSRSEKHIDGAQHFFGTKGFKQVLSQTDIVISLLPLTAETTYLLDQESLGWMPKGAQVINFSRGAVVNHHDLINLLDSQQIQHAVLDVFEQEPLPVSSELWSHNSITILPHISAPTQLHSASLVVARNIERYRTCGDIPTTINKQSGY
jgi:glyoxylate/hydroxypyruvate reductase A